MYQACGFEDGLPLQVFNMIKITPANRTGKLKEESELLAAFVFQTRVI